MRAQTAILTRVQLPLTIMGMPPAILPVVILVSATLMVAGLRLGYPATGFALAVMFALGASACVSVVNMRDPHYFAASGRERAFWQRSRKRVFLAGTSPRSVSGHCAKRNRWFGG